MLFFVDVSWALNVRGLLVVGHLGGIATALSYMLFGYGLRKVSVSRIGTLTLAEPLTAALLGILLLHEPISPTVLGGCGCILCGLLVLTMPHNKRG
ncbi:MAG: DMT family transporter [Chloroflexota bacterium]